MRNFCLTFLLFSFGTSCDSLSDFFTFSSSFSSDISCSRYEMTIGAYIKAIVTKNEIKAIVAELSG